ncbi:MAG: PRC-barrel domain-containing protein [Firmicutes bacterium]|nr:PRC-barrel domain-containing protein [Bacillota bacterium]
MRLSEIGDKEIVDITKGSLHGKLWDAEMLFDERSGVISALLVEGFQSTDRHMRGDLQLPWNSIVTIGDDLIIFKSTH